MMYTNIKYAHYAKLFQSTQKYVCKTNAICQFDRYGRGGVKRLLLDHGPA